ncbi:MAG: hypothetical protein DA328_09565, partial [Nitrososphaeraceae archaeon]|nr:hypothetical protein [Nitrososphaeraceae archaeon]
TVEPILDKPVEERTAEEVALLNKFNNKENFIERYKRRIIYAMVGGIATVILTYNTVVGDVSTAPYEGAFLYGILLGGIANVASSVAVPTPLIKPEQ